MRRPSLRAIGYWVLVVAVACVLVFLLLGVLESRDEGEVAGIVTLRS